MWFCFVLVHRVNTYTDTAERISAPHLAPRPGASCPSAPSVAPLSHELGASFSQRHINDGGRRNGDRPPAPALAPARLGRSATLWRRGWARAASDRVRPPLAQPRGLPSAWRRCPQRPRGSRAGGETFLVFHSELHMPLLDFHRIAPSSVTRQRSSHSERPAGESSGVISVIKSHLGPLESSRGGASRVVCGEGSRHLGPPRANLRPSRVMKGRAADWGKCLGSVSQEAIRVGPKKRRSVP